MKKIYIDIKQVGSLIKHYGFAETGCIKQPVVKIAAMCVFFVKYSGMTIQKKKEDTNIFKTRIGSQYVTNAPK